QSPDGGATWLDRAPDGPRDTHQLACHDSSPGRWYSAAGDGYFESRDGGDLKTACVTPTRGALPSIQATRTASFCRPRPRHDVRTASRPNRTFTVARRMRPGKN